MGIVSSVGIGSGIDIQTLVSQLVTAEGQPAFNAISRQQSAANTRLSGLGTLKSALSDFQTAVSKLKDGNLFKTHTATSSDESIVKAAAGAGSVAGSYGVTVANLAKAQKTIFATSFANASTVVGSGTLSISTVGGASFSVKLDSSNNTLSGLRDAINKAAGNTSVVASIINVDSGSKLVLTGKNTGLANGFTVSGNDSDGNNADSSGLSQLFSGLQLPAEFADASEVVGTGTLTITPDGGAGVDIVVNSPKNTLSDLRDEINSKKVSSHVIANIVSVPSASGTGTVSKLVLSSTDPAQGFSVSGIDNDGDTADNLGLSRLFPATFLPKNPPLVSAEDAKITVDGQPATRSSNSITDVIQGMTLDLQSQGSATLSSSLDNNSINKTVSDFVTAYNKLHSVIKDLGKYGGSTDGAGNGSLIGNATLLMAATQVRRDAADIVESATGSYNSLAMIGIKIDKDGVMSLDSSKMNTALNADLQSVSDVFASSKEVLKAGVKVVVKGVAIRLYDQLNGFLQSGGPLDAQQKSLNKQLSNLTNRKADVQARMDRLQTSMLKQFTAMDSAVGQFKNTGSFLSNWISKL